MNTVSGKIFVLQKFQSHTQKKVQEKAEELADNELINKIRVLCMFPRNAQFHKCCYAQYLAKRSTNSETSPVKKEHTSKAFIQVHDYITTEVIKNGEFESNGCINVY